MNKRYPVLILALIATCAIAGLLFWAQEKNKPEQKIDPRMKAAMEAMEKAAIPGENHAFLAKLAGTWDCETKFWMGPGEPQISKGSSKSKMVLDGRFLREVYQSTFMGKPFKGVGFTGYDNTMKQFTGTWMDTMGTGIGISTGRLDETGKVLTFKMVYPDPVTAKPKESKYVLRIKDNDHHVMDMYETDAQGKDMKIMEVSYTRK